MKNKTKLTCIHVYVKSEKLIFLHNWISEKPRRTHDDITIFELSLYVSFFFVCKNVHCSVKMAVLWMLKAVLVHAQYVGQARTVQVCYILVKLKRTMFRAVHVVLEVFMSRVLTVQNLSVLLQKYHTKQNPGRFLLSHPSASLPWNWVTLHKCSLLDGRD